jgi:hypothetical protein
LAEVTPYIIKNVYKTRNKPLAMIKGEREIEREREREKEREREREKERERERRERERERANEEGPSFP